MRADSQDWADRAGDAPRWSFPVRRTYPAWRWPPGRWRGSHRSSLSRRQEAAALPGGGPAVRGGGGAPPGGGAVIPPLEAEIPGAVASGTPVVIPAVAVAAACPAETTASI